MARSIRTPVLEARNVTFAYGSPARTVARPARPGRGGGRIRAIINPRPPAHHAPPPVLSDFSARFVPGELVALTGPSGRGKSTLLYLLGLMTRPGEGEILLDGARVDHLPDAARARLRAETLGFVFQDALLDPTRTVLDNVVETVLYRLAERPAALERGRDLLREFGVDQRADARPGQISGGQAQRIALCRALLGDPRVLLADEPTGNLDRDSAALVLAAFRSRAAAGAAVIIATHDPALVAACDRVVEL